MPTESEEPRATYAVYDDRGEKVRGGFASSEKAASWLYDHPVYDVFDDEEEWRCKAASEAEAKMLIARWPGHTYKPRPAHMFDVLLEVM
jgi:hypothetical protein